MSTTSTLFAAERSNTELTQTYKTSILTVAYIFMFLTQMKNISTSEKLSSLHFLCLPLLVIILATVTVVLMNTKNAAITGFKSNSQLACLLYKKNTSSVKDLPL